MGLNRKRVRSSEQKQTLFWKLKRSFLYEKSLYDLLRNKQMNGNSDLLLYFQRFFIYRDGFLERSESVMGGSLFVPMR